MTDLDFESSQLQLLTDALRAGPGSPEWRAAVASLENSTGGDEYKLLYTARERLASGQKYREVRPGVGFTRKVFESIENEEATVPRTPMSANLLVALSAVVILGILAVVAYFVMPHGGVPTPPELAQTYFVNTVSQNNFDNSAPDAWGDWRPFGNFGGEIGDGGFRMRFERLTENYRGGGIYCQREMPANEPFSMQATVLIPKPNDDYAVGVFVTQDLNFSGESATGDQELVCLLRGNEASVVLPGGHVQTQGIRIAGGKTPIEVQLNVSGDKAAVILDGKTIWSGAAALDPAKPRFGGVRFLARAGKGGEVPVVKSVRIMTPQKP